MTPVDIAAAWEDAALGETLAIVLVAVIFALMCVWRYKSAQDQAFKERGITEALRDAYKLPVIRTKAER